LINSRSVATVVAKLFNIVRPNKAYFGQKDAQQCAVIQRMVIDLNQNVDIVVVPTVRYVGTGWIASHLLIFSQLFWTLGRRMASQ